MSPRPRIGITACLARSYELTDKPVGIPGQDMIMSSVDYSGSIFNAGGLPLLLPMFTDDSYAENLADELDGFLFSGGVDVSPLKYGMPPERKLGKIVPERDEFELKLLDAVLKRNKPVLAICRGYQLVNVYFGGTLHQDISDQKTTHAGLMYPKHEKIHRVTLSKGSIAGKAYNSSEIWTNSFHHQALDKVGDGLVVTGYSEDGMVEAFEHPGYKFLAGVQWHPEMMFSVYEEHIKIFTAFVNSI